MVEEAPERKPGKKEANTPKADPDQPPKKKVQTDSPAGTTPRTAGAGTFRNLKLQSFGVLDRKFCFLLEWSFVQQVEAVIGLA